MTLLGGHDPVGVVFYRDDDSREDLLEGGDRRRSVKMSDRA